MHPINKVILGTVQFGLDYGINNRLGKPSFGTVKRILDKAYAAGIKTLDTAGAYGDAIDIIAQYHQLGDHRFAVINKLQAKVHSANVSVTVREYLQKLDIPNFEAYLFHNYTDYINRKETVAELREEKEKGFIKNIGVSIYTNEEFEFLLAENQVDLIQLPFNLLDNENQRGALLKRAKEQGMIVHIRSVFLQGLFFKMLHTLPAVVKPLLPYLQRLHTIAMEENVSIGEIALGYALSNSFVDGVLIGVESEEQLDGNLQLVRKVIASNVIERINQIFVKEKELLNPVNWK